MYLFFLKRWPIERGHKHPIHFKFTIYKKKNKNDLVNFQDKNNNNKEGI